MRTRLRPGEQPRGTSTPRPRRAPHPEVVAAFRDTRGTLSRDQLTAEVLRRSSGPGMAPSTRRAVEELVDRLVVGPVRTADTLRRATTVALGAFIVGEIACGSMEPEGGEPDDERTTFALVELAEALDLKPVTDVLDRETLLLVNRLVARQITGVHEDIATTVRAAALAGLAVAAARFELTWSNIVFATTIEDAFERELALNQRKTQLLAELDQVNHHGRVLQDHLYAVDSELRTIKGLRLRSEVLPYSTQCLLFTMSPRVVAAGCGLGVGARNPIPDKTLLAIGLLAGHDPEAPGRPGHDVLPIALGYRLGRFLLAGGMSSLGITPPEELVATVRSVDSLLLLDEMPMGTKRSILTVCDVATRDWAGRPHNRFVDAFAEGVCLACAEFEVESSQVRYGSLAG